MAGIADGDKWQQDEETGEDLIPRRQSDYIDWMLENPHAFAADAEKALGIHIRTLRLWRRNPKFKAEWKRRSEERMIDTDRIAAVVEVLYENAVKTKDTAAAEKYLKYVERFLPPRRPIEADSEVEHLTDEELRLEVAQLLASDLGNEVGTTQE